ncbi:MAG: AAA-like domain-containing protein [Paludibacteraceae bacterium]|nr:AAA-like domain-containing protein [Paludibacteraceae bacterium]
MSKDNYTISQIFNTSGTMSADKPTYIVRKADNQLYDNIKKGNFCYVLAARQMGKSSLKTRVIKRLKKENYACVDFDMCVITLENVNTTSLYFTIITLLNRLLHLKIDIQVWIRANIHATPTARFLFFLEDVVLKLEKRNIVIFIDEIDSLLSFKTDEFSSDDFFAVIRALFNARAENPEFNRLNFVILGVATPNDLIRDKDRTPFNIGVPIHLDLFNIDETEPLQNGLKHLGVDVDALMSEIFYWTNGQPYLTHFLCAKVAEAEGDYLDINELVQNSFIVLTRTGESETHFNCIENRIIFNANYNVKMLELYQKLLLGQKVKSNNSDSEQLYLKLTGLVIARGNELQITNRIYENKFDKKWLIETFERIDRPLASDILRWLEMDKAETATIKGPLLMRAFEWEKSRNDLTALETEYFDFLRQCERLDKERRRKKRFKLFLFILIALISAVGLFFFFWNIDVVLK